MAEIIIARMKYLLLVVMDESSRQNEQQITTKSQIAQKEKIEKNQQSNKNKIIMWLNLTYLDLSEMYRKI